MPKKKQSLTDVKCYLVKWVSRITGKTGHGTTLFTQTEVVKLCNTLNFRWPELDHSALAGLTLKMGIL